MKRMSKIIAVLLAVITLTSLVACSSAPQYTTEEALKNGYALFNADENTKRVFKIDIIQGSSYEYIFDGTIANGRTSVSLTVLQKGLKQRYKNLFVTEGDKLYINLNNAMTATEEQVDFIFTESKELQGKYLVIPDGRKHITELITSLDTVFLHELTTLRNKSASKGGSYDYLFSYSHDDAAATINAMNEKVVANQKPLEEKIDSIVNACVGEDKDELETILGYLQDCISVDTGEKHKDAQMLGAHTYELISQEMNTLKTVFADNSANIQEGITWNAQNNSFTHDIMLWLGDKLMGSIKVSISDAQDTQDPKADLTRTMSMHDFLPQLLVNVKNAKGVGYETHDFPYDATYTVDTLTLTAQNNVYKVIHSFVFTGQTLFSYSVQFTTYEKYMHEALAQKYDTLKYKIVENNSSALNYNGSGSLFVYTESLDAAYEECTNPAELLAIIQQIGVPSYDKPVA